MAAVMLRLMASGGLVAVSIRPCEDNSRSLVACLSTARNAAGRAHVAGGMCCARHAHEHWLPSVMDKGPGDGPCKNVSRCTKECAEQRHPLHSWRSWAAHVASHAPAGIPTQRHSHRNHKAPVGHRALRKEQGSKTWHQRWCKMRMIHAQQGMATLMIKCHWARPAAAAMSP